MMTGGNPHDSGNLRVSPREIDQLRIALKSHDSALEDYAELSARRDAGLVAQSLGGKNVLGHCGGPGLGIGIGDESMKFTISRG